MRVGKEVTISEAMIKDKQLMTPTYTPDVAIIIRDKTKCC